jgi:hypothetical protein
MKKTQNKQTTMATRKTITSKRNTTTTKRATRRTNNTTSCSKQWLASKKVRPKTVVIVAERTQSGYTVKSATVRVSVNQYSKTAVPITDLGNFVKDLNTKGIRTE